MSNSTKQMNNSTKQKGINFDNKNKHTTVTNGNISSTGNTSSTVEVNNHTNINNSSNTKPPIIKVIELIDVRYNDRILNILSDNSIEIPVEIIYHTEMKEMMKESGAQAYNLNHIDTITHVNNLYSISTYKPPPQPV